MQRPLVYTSPLRWPTIAQAGSQAAAGAPVTVGQPVRPCGRLVLRGAALAAPNVRVRVGALLTTPAPADVRDEELIVALPPVLRAGVQTAQVLHEQLLGDPAVSRQPVRVSIAAGNQRLSAAPRGCACASSPTRRRRARA